MISQISCAWFQHTLSRCYLKCSSKSSKEVSWSWHRKIAHNVLYLLINACTSNTVRHFFVWAVGPNPMFKPVQLQTNFERTQHFHIILLNHSHDSSNINRFFSSTMSHLHSISILPWDWFVRPSVLHSFWPLLDSSLPFWYLFVHPPLIYIVLSSLPHAFYTSLTSEHDL